MIKNIEVFPLLSILKGIEDCKEGIRLCNEGISEMNRTIEEIKLDIDNAVLESEVEDLTFTLFECTKHLSFCVVGKETILSNLKHINFIFN